MEKWRFQFTVRRLLAATVWVAIGFAMWRVARPFDVQHFLDDDPDNIRPRMLAALFIVPLAGAIGSLRGRPLAAPAKAFFLWVPLCVVIFVVGLMGLF
jgi:hypothetical protein